QLEEMKASFLNNAPERDFLLVRIDLQIHFIGRPIRNPPVQWVFQPLRRVVEIRRSFALKAAADQHFVKAVEPAQAARFAQIDKRRMDWTSYRLFPADRVHFAIS